jgi:replicative DNA helicase
VSWDELAAREGDALAFLATGYLEEPAPVPTCVAPLDEALGGGLRPGLSVLGGEPGAGKSALALTIALLTAWRGCRCLYVSLEMGRAQCWLRLASALSALPETRGLSPFRWADGWRYARETARGGAREAPSRYRSGDDPAGAALLALSRLPGGLVVCDSLAAHGLDGLDALVRDAAGAGASLVVVDYAQLVQTVPGASEYDRVSAVSGAIGAEAAACGLPVLLLSSLSRATGRDGPGLHSFRGSGQLEYDANAAMLLARDGDGDARGERPVRLDVLKNRWGEVTGDGGGVPLSLDGAHSLMRWEAMADGRGAARDA